MEIGEILNYFHDTKVPCVLFDYSRLMTDPDEFQRLEIFAYSIENPVCMKDFLQIDEVEISRNDSP